jgi:alkylation response protein AidB-like acyl-CoA dehydrogenase
MIEHAGSAAQRDRWLPALAAGETAAALVRRDGGELAPDATADGLAVVVDDAAATAIVYGPGAIEAVEAIDPGRRHGTVAEALPDGEPLDRDVREGLDRALVVVAAELLGLCRRALDLTVAYVKDRRQFGAPVGSFQAVQHAAAQMLRDTEATAAATYFAAWVADAEPASLPAAAAMAKAVAADAGRAVTASAIQLHGGIGFTWEADLHWLFKRAQIDATYLGGASHHRSRVFRVAADARARLVPA